MFQMIKGHPLIMNYEINPYLSALAIAALMLPPQLAQSQSLLLSAEDFVLLCGTAVTIAGAGPNTYSNGNVGSALSISGFPPPP